MGNSRFVSVLALISVLSALCRASTPALLAESKQELFLSAPTFAVVGASDDESKFGTIVFKTMLDQGLDVVPINPFVPESHGVSCLNSLAALPDPARTAISIVTQPAATLEILRQASALGIFAVWLQPGAEDAAVLEFIANANSTAGTTTYIHSTGDSARRSLPTCGNTETPDVISTLVH
ncbi:CoA binding domain-containing protein [Mycena filopes]|nr:CoA binding domain-containing protein [Mycena filopes]